MVVSPNCRVNPSASIRPAGATSSLGRLRASSWSPTRPNSFAFDEGSLERLSGRFVGRPLLQLGVITEELNFTWYQRNSRIVGCADAWAQLQYSMEERPGGGEFSQIIWVRSAKTPEVKQWYYDTSLAVCWLLSYKSPGVRKCCGLIFPSSRAEHSCAMKTRVARSVRVA